MLDDGPGYAAAMSMDPQDAAEQLDEDKIGDDDRTGEGPPDYPPDEPLGVKSVGVTPVEEDAGESFAERTRREEPEVPFAPDAARTAVDDPVGQLEEPDGTVDEEPQLLADAVPGDDRSAEEAAMHLEPDPDGTDSSA